MRPRTGSSQRPDLQKVYARFMQRYSRPYGARRKARDVAPIIAQSTRAEISGPTRHSTGRTYRASGADRQARPLHGRNRAFLVRTRKFRPPVRESTPAVDPTLVRVLVARPRGYPAHGGVARRRRQDRQEKCGICILRAMALDAGSFTHEREAQRQHPHGNGDYRCPLREGEVGLAQHGRARPLGISLGRADLLG